MIHRAPLSAFGHLGERRWPGGFFPGAAEIGGTKNGGTEVTGFRRRQQRAPIARVEHQMIEDVTEKVRSVAAPRLARRVAVKQPCALARGDEYQHPTGRAAGALGASRGHFIFEVLVFWYAP